MKVGTDAILLGVWSDVDSVKSILDVGSGSGIISLLLASRSSANIDAVEIDPASVKEASENFNNSSFSKQLHIIHSDYTAYANICKKRYDLVISNPPFFVDFSFKPKEVSRKNARHSDTLDFEQLCEGVSKTLNPDGKFCLVLPKTEKEKFLRIALQSQLHLQKQMFISPKTKQPANRVNLQLGFNKRKEIQNEHFSIRENDLTFTNQFINFLKDYYIGFD